MSFPAFLSYLSSVGMVSFKLILFAFTFFKRSDRFLSPSSLFYEGRIKVFAKCVCRPSPFYSSRLRRKRTENFVTFFSVASVMGLPTMKKEILWRNYQNFPLFPVTPIFHYEITVLLMFAARCVTGILHWRRIFPDWRIIPPPPSTSCNPLTSIFLSELHSNCISSCSVEGLLHFIESIFQSV